MARARSFPEMPFVDKTPDHPAWDLLEAQGLALEKAKVLAEMIANDLVEGGDVNVLADVILDALATAEDRRMAALDTLR